MSEILTFNIWKHLPIKDKAEDLNVQNYLLFILYFWLLIFRIWILAQISLQLIWLIWQWLVLCKADDGLDYSFYCCQMEKFICVMTCVWDAGRSGPLSSIEMYVQINVDPALILLLYNFDICLKMSKYFFFFSKLRIAGFQWFTSLK